MTTTDPVTRCFTVRGMRGCYVLIIGAGVSGLTTAVCLAEAGLAVRVWADAPPAATTSAVAGAMWSPYRASGERVLDWSRRTFEVLRELAKDERTGVRMASTLQASRTPVGEPWWASAVPGLRRATAGELPTGFADGFRFTIPVADMPVYLAYLLQRFRAAGGDVEHRRVRSLDEATQAAPVVVNCTGLGARDLAPDPSVFPVRGQVVIVENPGLEEVWVEQTGGAVETTYVIPHPRAVVLGGTAEDHDWRTEPDPASGARIIARCAQVRPELAEARVLAHRVGLRPARPTIRLEEERRSRSRIIHNYGHGGSGYTVSWGCAHTVAAWVLTDRPVEADGPARTRADAWPHTRREDLRLEVIDAPYEHPDALALMRALDDELARIYGSGDREPVDPNDFSPPNGLFLIGYTSTGQPVACGAYRLRRDLRPGQLDAEIKRMYVTPAARGHGYGRAVLAALEDAARKAGATRAVLETGILSRAAVALYTRAGYRTISPYSTAYAGSPTNRGFAREL